MLSVIKGNNCVVLCSTLAIASRQGKSSSKADNLVHGVSSFSRDFEPTNGKATLGLWLSWQKFCLPRETGNHGIWKALHKLINHLWKMTCSLFYYLIIIIIIIYPLTTRVIGVPQMISQPVFSIFPCSSLPSWTCWTPGLSIPWCCLPTSFIIYCVIICWSYSDPHQSIQSIVDRNKLLGCFFLSFFSVPIRIVQSGSDNRGAEYCGCGVLLCWCRHSGLPQVQLPDWRPLSGSTGNRRWWV